MARTNISIHPRRPRLTDLKVEVPKDEDGAYRAEGRIDGKLLNIPRSVKNFGARAKKEDGEPSSFVSE